MQAKFPGFGELAETGAEGEEGVAGDGGGEVGEGFADVVDAVFLDAEDVAVGGAFGVGRGGGVGEEGFEGLAGVVGEFFEERFGFGVGEGAHDGGDCWRIGACVRRITSASRDSDHL